MKVLITTRPTNICFFWFGPCAQNAGRHSVMSGFRWHFADAIDALCGRKRSLQPKQVFGRQRVLPATILRHILAKECEHMSSLWRQAAGFLDSFGRSRFRDKRSGPDIIKTWISLFYIIRCYTGRRDNRFASHLKNTSTWTVTLGSLCSMHCDDREFKSSGEKAKGKKLLERIIYGKIL